MNNSGKRNKKRIPEIITLLHVLWNKYPDQRFMQMMSNVMNGVKKNVEFDDYFWLDDDKFKEAIVNIIQQGFGPGVPKG